MSAEPKLDPSTQLRNDVAATHGPATVEFTVMFKMERNAQGYLKVSPRPGNPVFGNGTVDGAGWWTEVVLDGPSGNLFAGKTTGDPPLDFGPLQTNTSYVLRLRAHAPAGAVDQPTNYTLDYILAEHVASTSSGSGGTLDESVGLHAVLRVQGEAPAPQGFHMPVWAWAAIGVAVLAIVGGVIVAMARRAPRPKGPGPQE